MAIEAAYKLAKRYHKRGKYIKAWENETMKVDLMIDTMMNLPLLFWAAEESGDGSLARIAVDHAKTTAKTLVRHDGSTYHIYLVDLNTGTLLTGKTTKDDVTSPRGRGDKLGRYTVSPYVISTRETETFYSSQRKQLTIF